MIAWRLSFLILSVFLTTQVQARKLVQILHTNDLHAYFEHTVVDQSRGGYAAVKAKMDQLQNQASLRGIPTLKLDAGDFSEGNIFYLPDRGRRTFEIMNLMGFDAVAIGNHDWLMGSEELDQIIKDIKPQFEFLGANFTTQDRRYSAIRSQVKPYALFDFHGLRLGVMGLTSSELLYSWRFNNGTISDPVRTAQQLERRMKNNGVDIVLALTHIGFEKDKDLARATEHIDLIVGGHSHTALFDAHYEKNSRGREIPIVQAGSHGRYIGQLLIEIDEKNKAQVVDYRLVPVSSEGQVDSQVVDYVARSRELLHDQYGEDYLHEVLAHTYIPLDPSSKKFTPWTQIVTEAICESVGADIAFHSPGFGGVVIPPGPVTRELIFNSYPRVFDFDDKYGWYVWKVDVYGLVLKSLVRLILQTQQAASFTGITFDLRDDENDIIEIDPFELIRIDRDDSQHGFSIFGRFLGVEGNYRVANILVNGEPINPMRRYRVAMPEGIVLGGLGITTMANYLLRQISRSDVTLWDAIADKVKNVGVIGTPPVPPRRPRFDTDDE